MYYSIKIQTFSPTKHTPSQEKWKTQWCSGDTAAIADTPWVQVRSVIGFRSVCLKNRSTCPPAWHSSGCVHGKFRAPVLFVCTVERVRRTKQCCPSLFIGWMMDLRNSFFQPEEQKYAEWRQTSQPGTVFSMPNCRKSKLA